MENRFLHHLLIFTSVKNVNVKHVNDYCKEIHKEI